MIVFHFFLYGKMHVAHVPMGDAHGHNFISFLANARLRAEVDARWFLITDACKVRS